jgi:pantoate--beta-alanine ligase
MFDRILARVTALHWAPRQSPLADLEHENRRPTIMTRRPRIARTVRSLRRELQPLQRGGKRIALVPTMGALHDGHRALIRLARKRADRVVVSVFVNPAQFAPHEDFGSYPRPFAADLATLAAEKVDLVWAPPAAEMYPPAFATQIVPQGPAAAGLEDKFRPHFFSGVATVVAKLLIQCWPDIAVFGEKDYQQLKVVTRIAADLDLPTRIVAAPTVREKDGLALSSRNAYLSAEQRAVAPTLYRVLRQSADAIAGDRPIAQVLDMGRDEIARAGFALDYLEARHAETLAPIASKRNGMVRLLVAARIGTTRLIDNVKG